MFFQRSLIILKWKKERKIDIDINILQIYKIIIN